MLRQFFSQAETHAHPVADPDQRRCQQAPDHQNHGEGEDDRQPLVGRQHQRCQFVAGQVELVGPTGERTVGTGKLFFEAGQCPANQAQHALFGGRLGLLGGVAQFLQIGQQFASLLIVLQRLDHFIQGLPQRFLCLGLGFRRTVEQARQANCLGGRHRQQRHQADKEKTRQGKQTSEH
ncbi:hypothetical protein D3C71_1282900 [compost metagenome]